MCPVLEGIRERAKARSARILYPEPLGRRTFEALSQICAQGIARPVLIGDKRRIESRLQQHGLPGKLDVIDVTPVKVNAHVAVVLEQLRGRGFRESEVQQRLQDATQFAAAMICAGEGDGLVLGPTVSGYSAGLAISLLHHDRSPLWRSALVLSPGGSQSEALLFADVAGGLMPSASELADISLGAAELAQTFFEQKPRVALLATSVVAPLTRPNRFESAEDRLRERIQEAIATARARNEEVSVEPDLQVTFPSAGSRREAAGGANTFVLADAQPVDLAHQLRRRFPDVRVIGSVLRGLDKPVAVLTADCPVEDIVDMTAVTAGG